MSELKHPEHPEQASDGRDETAGGIAGGGASGLVAEVAGQHPDAASFSINVAAVAELNGDQKNGFLEFDPDMPELVVRASGLGVEEHAAVRVVMAQAAEELARSRGAGLSQEQQGSASSEGLAAEVRARRNWVQSSGQMRTDFPGRRAHGWNRFAG